jgi:hypothetical protein
MHFSQQTLSPQAIHQAYQCQPPIFKVTRQPPEEEKHPRQSYAVSSKVRGRANSKYRKKNRGCYASGFYLLLMMSFMAVVQGLSDCQIMEDWLPTMFTGAGTACCDQAGITCSGFSSFGRIIRMYVLIFTLF